MKKELLDLWGLNVASALLLATALMVAIGEIPFGVQSSKPPRDEPGCPWDEGIGLTVGDRLVLPASWRSEIEARGRWVIVFASSFPECGRNDFDYLRLFREARSYHWAICFDRPLSETIARFGSAVDGEGILMAGSDESFLVSSSRRIVRPSVAVVDSSGLVTKVLNYSDLIGGH